MSIERWYVDSTFRQIGDHRADLAQLERLQPAYVEVADSGTADALITVRHNLGRVPRGMRIVQAVVSVAGDIAWYRLDTDGPWTQVDLTFRLRAGNARLLLEVF